MSAPASFLRHGPARPVSPVVVSVPHAGRDYPLPLRAALRVPLGAIVALEDRHVDAVALAARGEETMFVQHLPRAWIDLNRGEHERDPKVDEGAAATATPMSTKLRAGLGLVPGRISPAGGLWRQRFSADDIQARIRHGHRPYHEAIATALVHARDRFGTAVLLDLHSMPPLTPQSARMVIGDRFGRTAGARFVQRLEAVATRAGVPTALNTPYAGGHILDRHGAPRAGIHAIQLELDRSLYLDASLDMPGPGLDATVVLVRAIIAALADEALAGPAAIAAE